MLFNDRRNSKPQLPTKVSRMNDSAIERRQSKERHPMDLRNSPRKIRKYVNSLPPVTPTPQLPGRGNKNAWTE